MAGRADWLEPFQNWILTARNAGEIADSDSLQQKRVLALEVFGSNLVLDCKKARGSCVKPWSLLVETSQTGGVVRAAGVEPTTFGSGGRRSIQLSYARRRFHDTGALPVVQMVSAQIKTAGHKIVCTSQRVC
jgi:hypothetical protein